MVKETKMDGALMPIIADEQMFTVEGQDVQKYNAALKRLGYDEVTLQKFKVDRQGYSLEVAAVLGDHYLDSGVIILSEEQNRAKLLRESECAFMGPLLEKSYSQASGIIRLLSKKEALMGLIYVMPTKKGGKKGLVEILNEDKKNVSSVRKAIDSAGLLSDVDAHFAIITALDTPNGALQKMQQLVKDVERLDANPSLVMDNEYLNGLLARFKEVNLSYGNIRGVSLTLKPSVVYKDTFKLRTPERDFYVLSKDKESLVIYFGKKIKKEEGIVNGQDKEKVLSALLMHNIARINKEYIEGRIKEVEQHILKDSGNKLEGLDLIEKYKQLAVLMPKIAKNYKKKLVDLYNVVKDKKSFDSLSLELKCEIVELLYWDDPIVSEAIKRANIA